MLTRKWAWIVLAVVACFTCPPVGALALLYLWEGDDDER